MADVKLVSALRVVDQAASSRSRFTLTSYRGPRAMAATIVRATGRLTIPAAVRSAMGIEVGDRVVLVELEHGRIEVFAANLPVTSLKGLVGNPAQAVGVDDMNTAMALCAAKPS